MLPPFVSSFSCWAIYSLTILSLGCAQDGAPTVATVAPPYDFDRPDAAFDLPGVLREVSGLTLLPDGHLGAVQDEDGIIFLIDAESGEVVNAIEFGDPGDYEGIAAVDADIFVLNSGGTLFRVSGWEDVEPRTERLETPLDARCDAEGLAYDQPRGRLLIACKEYPGPHVDDGRSVFAFDLATSRLLPEPALVLRFAAVAAHFRATQRGSGKLIDKIYKLFGDLLLPGELKPSAVAIHPLTEEVYVLSSAGPMIVVMNANGELLNVWALSGEHLPQAEGLSFLENGDLFISTEGNGRPGRLFRYNLVSSRAGDQ